MNPHTTTTELTRTELSTFPLGRPNRPLCQARRHAEHRPLLIEKEISPHRLPRRREPLLNRVVEPGEGIGDDYEAKSERSRDVPRSISVDNHLNWSRFQGVPVEEPVPDRCRQENEPNEHHDEREDSDAHE